MAISTKADLMTEAADWLDNPAWFSDKADNFVLLAEARLNRALKGRLAQAETNFTGTVGVRTLTLPSDYSEPVALWLTTFNIREPLKAYVASELPYNPVNGIPIGWAISNSTIVLDAPCDQAHTFVFRYYQKFSLASDSATNWLLANWPDTYLASVLVEAYAFRKDADAANIWNQRLQAAIEEINEIDTRGEALAPLNVDMAIMSRRGFNIIRGY